MTDPFSQSQIDAAIEVARRELAENDLYFFLQEAWHEVEGGKPFVGGWFTQTLCEHMEELYYGRINRLLVNCPPRSTKSLIISVLFPVWCWIKNPSEQIMTISYAEKLAKRDNVKSRRLIKSDWFQKRWGDRVRLSDDQDTKERVDNMQGGYRVVVGMDSGIVGEGSNCMLLDDCNNTNNMSEASLESALSVYTDVLPTRFNDLKTGRMCVVQQRVDERDISGWIIANQPEFVKLILPMEFESSRRCTTVPLKSTNGKPWSDPRTEEGELLMPNRVGQKELKSLKNAMASEYAISGQLQQRPAPAEGGMIKKAWFQQYKSEFQPKIKFTIQAWDTASSIRKEAAFSACITVGIFDDEQGYPSLILLGAWRKKVEFPELYKTVQRMGQDYRATTEDRPINLRFKPDLILVEEKSTGIPLIQTLNRAGLNLTAWRPDKYGDKIERVRRVTHLLESGRVYVPMQAPDYTKMKKFADVLVMQCVAGHTKILTSDGLKKIKDIKIGDKVFTHLGQFKKVTAKSERIANSVLKIQSKSLDDLIITSNHDVFCMAMVNNGTTGKITPSSLSWVPAGELEPRIYKKSNRGALEKGRSNYSCMTIPSHHYEKKQTINFKKYIKNRKDIATSYQQSGILNGNAHSIKSFVDLDYDFGFIIGLYLAEGSCTKMGQTRWSLNFKKEIPLAEKVRDILIKKISANTYLSFCKRSNVVNVNMASTSLVKFWESFGSRSWDKKLPKWVFESPLEFKAGLLEGWATGDGYRIGNEANIATTSETLVWQMRIIAAQLGICAGVKKIQAKLFGQIRGRFFRSKDMYILNYRTNKIHKGMEKKKDDYYGFEVEKKQEILEPTIVYNLNVEDDESYLTTSGIVHNCITFPAAASRDFVDCLTMILQRIINSGWILHPMEEQARIAAEFERDMTAPQEKAFY